MTENKIRVLMGKPGLDGHDHGAKVVVRAMMDAGFEVIYTGLRKTPRQIAEAASNENVDVIGLSSMAGSHIPFCQKLKPLLKEYNLEDKLWIIGGNVPKKDHEALQKIGIDAVFPTGSHFDDIIDYIRSRYRQLV
ncbi:MAG: cobalamin B12-binding domain-containing protein [Alphaproteobacteria bacterium]|nr:cobalamin B12-binding domain-containing protein [Alphaproteobacteria bacterium]